MKHHSVPESMSSAGNTATSIVAMFATTAALAIGSTPPVMASPLFETSGAQLGSGGFNARFTPAGSASAYFNPALLSSADNGISVGFTASREDIQVSLFSREGLDINVPSYPDSLRHSYDGQVQPFDRLTFPTEDLYAGCTIADNPCSARPRQGDGSGHATRLYSTVGLVNHIIEDKLVVGFYAMIPLGDYTTARSFYVDEREQFFSNSLHPELYGDRMTAPSLSMAVASEPVDGFSIGLAFTISLLNNATAGVYVPNAGNQQETLELTTDVGVTARVAPHLGLSWEALEGLTFNGTVHTPSKFEIVTGFTNLLPSGDEQPAVRTAVHDWMPWQFALGFEYTASGPKFDTSVVAGANLALWSHYRNRVNERPVDGYEWSNTVTLSLGMRMSATDWSLMADAVFSPTPVPEQTGRTNYVDNNRIGGMVGGEYRFDAGESLRIGIGASAQLQGLLQRRHDKVTPDLSGAVTNPLDPNFGDGMDMSLVRDELPDDVVTLLQPDEPWAPAEGFQTNNPGYPGYESRGVIYGGSVYISLFY